jgi:signal transduction histidine kinase
LSQVLKTLKSRALVVLVASLALSHLVGLWLYARKHEEAASLLQDALLADRIALTARLLEEAKPEERERLVARLDSPLVKISTRQAAVSPAPKIEGTRPHLFEHLVGLFLDRPGHEGIGTAYAPAVGPSTGQSLLAMLSATLDPGPHHLPAGTLDEIRTTGTVITGIALGDGGVIEFSSPLLTVSPFSALKLWAPLLAILLSVIVSGAWVLNRATEPLMTFARAAERLGEDIHADPLPESGAAEVRSASRAFNAMQERIQRLLEDRTAFAAAMAHDIGTPVTRLMLRLEELPESEVKARIASDIAQMQRMIKATLGFARAEFQAEPSERFDVVALVQSIADDLTDMGAPVTSSGVAHLPVVSKPIALRRAIANLAENAAKYGDRATITVSKPAEAPGVFVITIDDEGPGIPTHLHEEAFRPFRRLTAGSYDDVDGTGLGLSVARSVARTLGGDVALKNRPTGGLRVLLTLPLRK